MIVTPPSRHKPGPLSAGPALAQQWEPPQIEGAYLRFGVGLGVAGLVCADEPDCLPEDDRGGINRGLGLSAGYALVKDLVFTLDYDGFWASGPSGGINSQGLGAGLAWYFVPGSVWLSSDYMAALAVTQPYGGSDDIEDSGHAHGFRLALGKDWWVGDGFAAGISAQYTHAWLSWDGSETSYSLRSGAVMVHVILVPRGTTP